MTDRYEQMPLRPQPFRGPLTLMERVAALEEQVRELAQELIDLRRIGATHEPYGPLEAKTWDLP